MKRRRSAVVCVHQGKLLLVWLEEPLSKRRRLFPPGGLIEPEESAEECAVRETFEETGYRVTLSSPGKVYCYPYEWDGARYECETFFFIAHLAVPKDPPSVVNDDPMNKGVEWVACSKVAEVLSFHGTIQEAVLGCIHE